MSKLKITWKVAPPPTGKYRSFEHRQWPTAYYPGEIVCARITCEDQYVPRNVKEKCHRPLTLWVANHSVQPWAWRKCTKTFASLSEAKDAVLPLLDKYTFLIPGKYHD